MFVKELFGLLCFIAVVSARHYVPHLKAGTYGYMVDGQVVKTWTPDEFDEWRSTNPLVELIMLMNNPNPKPADTQGSAAAGPTSSSQASSSVGNGGSFASAAVQPQLNSLPHTPLHPQSLSSTENATKPQVQHSVDSVTKDEHPPQVISESSSLNIDAEPSTTSSGNGEKVSEKENEIVATSGVESSSTALPQTEPSKKDSGRPSNSRPGFSSATSSASTTSEVHAEGSALAESPSSASEGLSQSNSNSASVVYGEFMGSVSISTSSSSG